MPCRVASRLSARRTPGSIRMAISWRASVPSGGRPTRRTTRSCLGDSSGMSEKSITFEPGVGCPFFTAGPASADDTDAFAIVNLLTGYATTRTPPAAAQPTRRRRFPQQNAGGPDRRDRRDRRRPSSPRQGTHRVSRVRGVLGRLPLEHSLSIYNTGAAAPSWDGLPYSTVRGNRRRWRVNTRT
jgi:hypothetical protein